MLLISWGAVYPDAMPIQDQLNSFDGKLLTVPEAADRLKLQPSTIRKWIFQRRLAHVRIGRRTVRIREADVEKLIRDGYAPAK